MTSILSSLTPFNFSGVSSASQVSGDQSLLDQLDSQQTQNSANNAFGGAYSLNLSDAALGLLGDNSSTNGDPTAGILNALTYSNFFNNSSGEDNGIGALLGNLGNSISDSAGTQNISAATDSGAPGTTSFAEAELADGGPLPAFLAYVDVQMHLSATQQQSLQAIAAENMNVDDTPATVQMIAGELQQAGIPETI